MADASSTDFSGMRALFINCTRKKSPEPSHTQGLIDVSTSIMATTMAESLAPASANVE